MCTGRCAGSGVSVQCALDVVQALELVCLGLPLTSFVILLSFLPLDLCPLICKVKIIAILISVLLEALKLIQKC